MKILNEGGALFEQGSFPITLLEIEQIDQDVFAKKVAFEEISVGDTNESSSLECCRIKKRNDPLYQLEGVQDIIEKKEFISFIETQTKETGLQVSRCQAHIYKEGDFLSLHNDTDSFPDYKYSCVLSFASSYEGGEFRLHNGEKILSFKLPYGNLLIIKSGLEHEVLPVLKGERRVLVFFLTAQG